MDFRKKTMKHDKLLQLEKQMPVNDKEFDSFYDAGPPQIEHLSAHRDTCSSVGSPPSLRLQVAQWGVEYLAV